VCLLKLHFVKIVNYGSSVLIRSVVMWLHILAVSLLMYVPLFRSSKKEKSHITFDSEKSCFSYIIYRCLDILQSMLLYQ